MANAILRMKLVTSIAVLSPWLLPSLYIPPVKRDWPPPATPTFLTQHVRVKRQHMGLALSAESNWEQWGEGKGEDYLFIYLIHSRQKVSPNWLLSAREAGASRVQQMMSALSPWELLDRRFIISSYSRSILIRRVKGPPRSKWTGQRSAAGVSRMKQ